MSVPGDVGRSKRLSLVLRHRPWLLGLSLDLHGWVDVTTLLDALASHGHPMTREDLDRVVRTNDKKRFEWDMTTDRIRARQGHSVAVDLELEPADPPQTLFHGTPRRNVASIGTGGLDRRRRHHVHLSPDQATAARVGARRGEHVVLTIDAGAMSRAGHRFWLTSNGVWLTDSVPPEFIGFPE